jgi:SAM-dependent methyltransferase
MLIPWRRSAATASLMLLAAVAVHAQPRSRGDCEAAFSLSWGRAGKDVPWVPTFDAVVLGMLSIAEVTPQDRVLDLGAGDGRIAITAAKPPFGAIRAVGIEYDPPLAKLAACLVEAEGLNDRVRIVEGDIFKEDFGDASVVTMYLLPHINLCIRHRLLALAPGTRVVSHQYAMADWTSDQSVQIQGRDIRLWVVPARVDGVWDFKDSEGATFTADLRQTFGTLSARRPSALRRYAAGTCASRSTRPAGPYSCRARSVAERSPASCERAPPRARRSAGSAERSAPRPGPRCCRAASATTTGSPLGAKARRRWTAEPSA